MDSRNVNVVKAMVVGRHDNGDLAVKYQNTIGTIPVSELYDTSEIYFSRNHYKEIPCVILSTEPLVLSVRAYVRELKKNIADSLENQYPYYVEGTVMSISGNLAFVDIGGITASLSICDFCRARMMQNIGAVISKGEVVTCRIKRLYTDVDTFLSREHADEVKFSEVWLERDKSSCIEEAERLGIAEGMLFKVKLGEPESTGHGRFVLFSKDLVGMIDYSPLLQQYKVGDEICVKILKIKSISDSAAHIRCEFIGPAELVDNGSFVMPDVTNLKSTLARTIISSFTAKIKTIYTEDLPENVVGRTDPCPGDNVPAGTVVTLYSGYSENFLINREYNNSSAKFKDPETFSIGDYTYKCLFRTKRGGAPLFLRNLYSLPDPEKYLESLRMFAFLHYATKDMFAHAYSRLNPGFDDEEINNIISYLYNEGAIQYYLRLDENRNPVDTAIYSLSSLGKIIVSQQLHIQMISNDFTTSDELWYIMSRLAENRVMLSSDLNLQSYYQAYDRTHKYVTNSKHKRLDLHRMLETGTDFALIEGVRIHGGWRQDLKNKLTRIFDYIAAFECEFSLALVAETPKHSDEVKSIVSEMDNVPDNLTLTYVHDKQFHHELVNPDGLDAA